jgi:dTMP kinase
MAERLRAEGRDVLVVREPGGTPLAEEARRLFLDPALEPGAAAELFLLLVARADLVERVVRPALVRGVVVLADRFDLSTRAYQIAGRGMAPGAVLEANRLATGGLEPDLILVLDLPPEVGRARQAAEGKVRDRM